MHLSLCSLLSSCYTFYGNDWDPCQVAEDTQWHTADFPEILILRIFLLLKFSWSLLSQGQFSKNKKGCKN